MLGRSTLGILGITTLPGAWSMEGMEGMRCSAFAAEGSLFGSRPPTAGRAAVASEATETASCATLGAEGSLLISAASS